MRLLVPVLLLCLAAPPALADDAANVAAYKAALAKLPAPDKTDAAFLFEGEVIGTDGKINLGSIVIEASATTVNGSPGWRLRYVWDDWVEEALYDGTLTPVSGTFRFKSSKESADATWQTIPGGVGVTVAKNGGEPTKRRVRNIEPWQATSGTILLFSRLSGFAEGTFRARHWDPYDTRFRRLTWSLKRDGTWLGKPAIAITAELSGGTKIEAGFDPKTGEVLGMRNLYPEADDWVLYRPKPKSFYEADATTPQQAAAQATLALVMGDTWLFERVGHWPSLCAEFQNTVPDHPMPEATIKVLLLAQFAKSTAKLRARVAKKYPRDEVETLLEALVPKYKLRKTRDGTVVRVGFKYGHPSLTVKEFDGRWYLVKWPRRKK